jgi:hypothetical protein
VLVQDTGIAVLPNKAIKLTKLSPAPGRLERRLMPAPTGAGTASQFVASVGG